MLESVERAPRPCLPSSSLTPLLAGLIALGLGSCGGAAPTAPQLATTIESGGLEWASWGPEAFARAAAEDRLVLVDVGIEGCTACRWMYEDTYRDPDVVARIEAHFVPVAVDADVRPDVGERYARWGWPATIVLTPEGQRVLAIQGNRRPRSFVPILDELIARHGRGELDGADEAIDEVPERSELGDACAIAASGVRAAADEQRGGFGGGFRPARSIALRWESMRGGAYGDEAAEAHARRTLHGVTRMIDPVWGGVFVAARNPDFTGAIPEKRTIHQGPLLAAFAEALHRTGEPRYREAAADLDRYLTGFMRADDGAFFATQEDRAPRLPSSISAIEYYALDDEARRAYGVPPIDHGIYTDLNALVIEGYVRLYEATGEASHLEVARRAANAMLERRQRDGGWVAQVDRAAAPPAAERMRSFDPIERVYLEPQGPFGLALLALHSATGDARWLDRADRVAEGLALLEDEQRGGFYASDAPPPAPGLPRRRPFVENLTAARFLMRLGWAHHDEAPRERAARAVRAVAPPEATIREMGVRAARLGRLLDELTLGPVDVTVLGDAEEPAARALFDAGVRAYEPRKVVRYEAPGVRYPDQGRPAAFVCTDRACSSPVFEPAELAETIARMGEATGAAPCAPRD